MILDERRRRPFVENAKNFSKKVAAIILQDAIENQQDLNTALQTLLGPNGTDYAAQILGYYTQPTSTDQRILALGLQYGGINMTSADLRGALVEVLTKHLDPKSDTTVQ